MGKAKSNTESTNMNMPIHTNTSISNPYFNTKTNADGSTTSSFANGSAGQTAYNFVNQNIGQMLNDYLNPSLDSATNQAKLSAFNKQQQSNLQNNIINPLATNNMIRSSQATNMYNNLSNQSADYTQQLLANSQNDSWNMINNLMNLYNTGYTGASNDISTALGSSVGSIGNSNSKSAT